MAESSEAAATIVAIFAEVATTVAASSEAVSVEAATTKAVSIEATTSAGARDGGIIALGLQFTSAIVSIAVAEQLAAITWLAEKQVFAFKASVAEVSIAQVAPVEASAAQFAPF